MSTSGGWGPPLGARLKRASVPQVPLWIRAGPRREPLSKVATRGGIPTTRTIVSASPLGEGSPEGSKLAGPTADPSLLVVWDDRLNDMVSLCRANSPLVSVQTVCELTCTSAKIVVWENVPSLRAHFARSIGEVQAYAVGLVGLCASARDVIEVRNGVAKHPSASPLDQQLVGERQVVLLPIFSGDERVGVLEIIGARVEESWVSFARFLLTRLKNLFEFLLAGWEKAQGRLEQEIARMIGTPGFVGSALEKVRSAFSARQAVVYRQDGARFVKWTRESGRQEVLSVGCALQAVAGRVVNTQNPRAHPDYDPAVDGTKPEPVLAIPVRDGDGSFAVVLRGCDTRPVFGEEEVGRLTKVGSRLVQGIVMSDVGTELTERDSFAALLECAEVLTAQVDRQKIIELVTQKARGVTSADRCSLFLVEGDKIRSHFASGLGDPILLQRGQGLTGTCIAQGVVINVSDAYTDPRFDRTIDDLTGYKTRSCLVVPIFSTQGQCIGCTEMLNCETGPFTEDHEQALRVFNVFCGIALDNSNLLHDLCSRNDELNAMFQAAFAMSRADDVHAMLRGILDNSCRAIGAQTSAFLLVEGDAIKPFEGQKSPDMDVARRVIADRTHVIAGDSLGIPVLNGAGQVTAVVMVGSKPTPFNDSDVRILQVFASFAGVAETASHYDAQEALISEWMTAEERAGFDVPVKLRLTEAEQATMKTMACYASDFAGWGHIKEQFFFMRHFDFLRKHGVQNQRWFTFLHEVSARYTGTSYHNWTHACDVTQCVFFQVTAGGLCEIFEDWEIFTLLVAAICHDTNHRGLNNVYNVKAETPLGILFKDTSVMEMHHITESLPLLEQDGIFDIFQGRMVRKVWQLFISLILGTDMAKHFEFCKKTNTLLDEGNWDWTNEELRLMGLQLVLKVADISNVARPWAIADKWCDVLNMEFWHQGDLEKEEGIGLTSPLNDRDTANKPKSQIGFYTFVCLPLYSVVARVYPRLDCNLQQVKSNLEVWKDLVAKQAPPA